MLGCARECAKGWWSYGFKVFTYFFTPEMCGSLYVRLYGILHVCDVWAPIQRSRMVSRQCMGIQRIHLIRPIHPIHHTSAIQPIHHTSDFSPPLKGCLMLGYCNLMLRSPKRVR